jgi:hypothetical protein
MAMVQKWIQMMMRVLDQPHVIACWKGHVPIQWIVKEHPAVHTVAKLQEDVSLRQLHEVQQTQCKSQNFLPFKSWNAQGCSYLHSSIILGMDIILCFLNAYCAHRDWNVAANKETLDSSQNAIAACIFTHCGLMVAACMDIHF